MFHIRPTVAKRFAGLGLLLLSSALRGAPQDATVVSGPANQLPMGVVGIVFDFLSGRDVVATQQICTAWRTLFQGYDEHRQWQLVHPNLRFGTAEWEYFYGVIVTDAPSIPREWLFRLLRTCPIWPNQKMCETHLLTLIPSGLTLDRLGELIQRPLNDGHRTEYRVYKTDVKNEHGAKAVPASYWVLMTRHILPDSRNKTYDNQKALVATQAQRTNMLYAMPRGLEAATAILTHFVRTGERLYGDDKQDVRAWNDNKQSSWYTYTRCEERVSNNTSSVFVGGFASAGLIIYYYFVNVYGSNYGVSCLLSV